MGEQERPRGRGAGTNPNNRFDRHTFVREHFEGIDEVDDGSNKTRYIDIHPKTVINDVKSPDVGLELSVNPYQGCEHGCVYCYARNSHEFWGYSPGLDFERNILVKRNAPEILEKTLRKPSYRVKPITFSGNTDCYQPVEKELEITRRCLEVCAEFGNPVSIITKNRLITRDIDILAPMAKRGLVKVAISITTLQEDIRRKMEPRTATAKQRLNTIEELSNDGIPVHVMMAPIIPAINSHEIMDVVQAVADRGARSVGYTIVRLNGQIAEIFEEWIREAMPDRAEKVLNQIREMHGGRLNDSRFGKRMKGEGQFSHMVKEQFRIARKKYLAGREMPGYNLDEFRVPPLDGQLDLFT